MNDLIIPTNDIKDMAKAMGPLFGKTPENMFALMLIAQAEGKHPAIAAQEYDIIQGKPAINSRSAQARFQLSGGKVDWLTRTDAEVTATFSHPQGGSLTITWDLKRAAQAGLASKEMWKKYSTQMMSARVIAEGVRAVFPACLSGLYLPEEIQDFDTKPPRTEEPRNVTPAQPNPDKPLIKDIQDTEPEPQQTDEEIKAAEAAEAAKQAKIEAVKKITAIGREIAAIVKTPDNEDGWTEDEKIALDIKGIVKASRDSFDSNVCIVALRRVEIANRYRGTDDWPTVVKDLVALGMDIEALDQRKAGLSE